MDERRTEADTFYTTLEAPTPASDQALVMRQALAGMLWGQQYFEYDVDRVDARSRRSPLDAQAAPPASQRAMVPPASRTT